MKLLLEIVKDAESVSFGSTGSLDATEIRGNKVRRAAGTPNTVASPRTEPIINDLVFLL
jgi:hypothetical protein